MKAKTRFLYSALLGCSLLASACTHTLVEKPGSREFVEGERLRAAGDVPGAIEKYQEASEKAVTTDVKAQALVRLADLSKGAMTPHSREALLQQAADLGEPGAVYALAEARLNGEGVAKDPQLAGKLLAGIAGEYPQAGMKLAQLLRDGTVSPEGLPAADALESQALFTLREKAARGDTGAMLGLARGYREQERFADAEQWYRGAIARGNIAATRELGDMWVETGTRNNPKGDAEQLWKQAARWGDAGAMRSIGGMHEKNNQMSEAQRWYERAAKQGDASATLALGRLLIDSGHEAEGVSWLREAADKGSVSAKVELGRAYRDGVGLPVNRQRAIALFTEAMKAGSDAAALEIADAYAQGVGVPRNPGKAVEIYRIASARGSATATKRLARMYIQQSSGTLPEEARRLIGDAAAHGDTKAMLFLADAERSGRFGQRNPKAAFEWYQKAARLGSGKAMVELATAYGNGEGVTRDPKQADYWMRQAVAADPEQAMKLARAYEKGKGVPRDPARAAQLYEQAAKSGDPKAELALAKMYEVTGRADQAMAWYRKAAARGNPEAMYLLATGGGKDAAAWMEKAAKAGHPQAMSAYGKAFMLGDGVKKDPAQAVAWYRKAAEAGDVEGQYQLGVSYARGIGVARNIPEARVWLAKAQQNGYSGAGAVMDTLVDLANEEKKQQ